jgi:peroxiredoxin Q/BCP
MTLIEGSTAPAFSASDQDGNVRTLESYRGHWLLLYFYPMDDTPGCTAEACAFRDLFAELKDVVSIVGVSGDSAESHQAFRGKYHLPFELLADPSRTMIAAYGADGILFPKRVSFLISPEGVIRKIYSSVKPEEHAKEILEDAQSLRSQNG